MSKSRFFSSGKYVRLLVLFFVVLCISLFLSNNQIINKISHTISKTQRIIKFDLSPTVDVNSGVVTTIKPLSKTRFTSANGLLQVSSANPRYFTDESGKAIYLTGAHTWSNFQDSGSSKPPPKFNYTSYLDFLQENNHNFIRLWVWEAAGPWIQTTIRNYWFYPMPYQRKGPGKAIDGELKFDSTRFNQGYFDRLHERVKDAADRGIYVSVMLFNGWSVDNNKGDIFHSNNPWRTHPFNKANNINGIDGDSNGDHNGEEIHTLNSPTITATQETYVRKVVDTVNEFNNVLYEISNESHKGSQDWQYHMITYIKNYEKEKPKQHPVGMSVEFPDGDNSALYSSPADWIAPKGDLDNRPVADGKKVILSDTDHLCGICGNPQWVWKSFTRGENPVFMDAYDNAFVLNSTLKDQAPSDSLSYKPWVSLRRNLGYTLTYANRMNLISMTPRGDLASTEYCLASPTSRGAEYLVYAPSGGKVTVDLSATQQELTVEWLNPSTGIVTMGIKTTGGGNRSFTPPFSGDSVLYIKDASISS